MTTPAEEAYEQLVVCPGCEDLWCPRHELHYFECECPPIWADDEEDIRPVEMEGMTSPL